MPNAKGSGGDRYIGRDSPGSEEANEQGMSGKRGAEQARIPGMEKQPEQGSTRSPAARHEQEPERTKHFEAGHAPSEQGEKEHRSPEVVREHQMGAHPKSGSHSAHGERTEEEAQRGEPETTHTRAGRQKTPGHRPGHRS
jgi:hypothetical protein